ncbi:hypothetical protein GCM10009525_75570 [Streptosporangium amethystogenes subsp. fukuiense]
MARGSRRLRYIGTTKNNAWLHTRAAAVNLRALINLGLVRTDGTWTPVQERHGRAAPAGDITARS